MKLLVILGLLAIVSMGMASGQNFIQGEAKGADAPSAIMIGAGANQSMEVATMLGQKVVDLSGTSPDVFDLPMFADDNWVNDGGSYGRTPSMTAFLNDKTGENLRYSPKPGDW